MAQISSSAHVVNPILHSLLHRAETGVDSVAWGIVADWLEEQGDPRAGEVRRLLKRLSHADLVRGIYLARRDRWTFPEGAPGNAAWYWLPSQVEDCGGDILCRVRRPFLGQQWYYLNACRTRRHVAVLVAALRRGREVPADVCDGVARRRLLAELFPEMV